MRPYWAVFSARFRQLLQYRAAALAGFATQFFWGLMRIMVFTAFYASTAAALPMPLADTISYIWLGQAFLVVLPWNWDRETESMIRTGNVAYELCRPVSLYGWWFCRSTALRSAPGILRALPMLLVAGLFLGLRMPPSLASALAFAASMLAALFLSAALTTLMNVSMLWTLTGEGIYRLLPAAVMLFSGLIVPLPLMPDWFQPLVAFLPFRGLMDTPFRLYTGHIPASEAPAFLLHQAAWILALILLGRWMMARGLRRLVVQGG